MKSLYLLLSLALAAHIHALTPHPRLLATEKDWGNLPARMEQQPLVKKIVETTIARADAVLQEEPLAPKVTGRRMLSVSRDAVQRIIDLATAWKVTGKKAYFDRCRDELLNVCAFDDWHPIHHLDTAEMQTAVAIGYDWLFHELSEADRKTISTALRDKGLKSTLNYDSVRSRPNNWNQVCMAGMMLSAIALAELEPELSKKAIQVARDSIPNGLKGGYPATGNYAEGPGYWSYGTSFTILTIEALRSAGLPFKEIIAHPGFLKSGYYIPISLGNSGLSFNYGDNRESGPGTNPALVWMARENNSQLLREILVPEFEKIEPTEKGRFLALSAFWFPSEKEVKEDAIPLHFQGEGSSPVAIHRTSHERDGFFLGIKSGKAAVNHGHMDAGSFVLDWDGKRWASDLGAQDYHSLEKIGINLFQMTQTSDRWNVFRLNNFSHNTLTYNSKLHQMTGAAKIISSKGAPENATRIDLTPALSLPAGATAIRNFKIDPEKRFVEVTDRLSGLNENDTITWNLMTHAKPSKAEGGYKLVIGDSEMHLELRSDQIKSTTTTSADPPATGHDHPNPKFHRVILQAQASKDGEIVIRAIFQAP